MDDVENVEYAKNKLYEQLPDHIPEENRKIIVQLVFDICGILNNNGIRDIYVALDILYQRFYYLIDDGHEATVH